MDVAASAPAGFDPADVSSIALFVSATADAPGSEEIAVYLDSIRFANGSAGPFEFTSDLDGFVLSSSATASDATVSTVTCPF